MSVLSSNDIVRACASGDIALQPFKLACVQPASYDVHLGRRFMRLDRDVKIIDMLSDNSGKFVTGFIDDCLYVDPGDFVLGETVECITLSDKLNAQLAGVSSAARNGLIVQTAGYVDPGWHGMLTLELTNVTRAAILLYPGQRIGQLVFSWLETPAKLYNGKYLGAQEVQASRGYLDYGGKSPATAWAERSALRR
jgi:dCTP deaminase